MTDPTTPEERAELARLLEAATPGPWHLRPEHGIEEDHEHIDGPSGEPIGIIDYGEERSGLGNTDPALVVAAVNVLPRLLSDIERLIRRYDELHRAWLKADARDLMQQLEASRHDNATLTADRDRLSKMLERDDHEDHMRDKLAHAAAIAERDEARAALDVAIRRTKK